MTTKESRDSCLGKNDYYPRSSGEILLTINIAVPISGPDNDEALMTNVLNNGEVKQTSWVCCFEGNEQGHGRASTMNE